MTPVELEIRAAEAALIALKEQDSILRNGVCPHYWGHFDWGSFAFGMATAAAILLSGFLVGALVRLQF